MVEIQKIERHIDEVLWLIDHGWATKEMSLADINEQFKRIREAAEALEPVRAGKTS